MFAENLKYYRMRSGLTQKQVAEKLFIVQNSYSKYELGQSSPNPDSLKKLAEILGCTVGQLVGEENAAAGTADGSDINFTTQERELVETYRRLGLEEQMQLIKTLFDLESRCKTEKQK